VSGSCALATRVASGNRRFLVGLHHPEMMPRRSVAFLSRSPMLPWTFTSKSQGVTRCHSREWSVDPPSSCGVLSDTSRCVHREVFARALQAEPARVSSRPFPCGLDRMTRARHVHQGGYPDQQSVGEPEDIPRACVNRVRLTGNRVCPERKLLPEPVASMESRSTARRRAHLRVVSHPAASLRRGLGLLPWGF